MPTHTHTAGDTCPNTTSCSMFPSHGDDTGLTCDHPELDPPGGGGGGGSGFRSATRGDGLHSAALGGGHHSAALAVGPSPIRLETGSTIILSTTEPTTEERQFVVLQGGRSEVTLAPPTERNFRTLLIPTEADMAKGRYVRAAEEYHFIVTVEDSHAGTILLQAVANGKFLTVGSADGVAMASAADADAARASEWGVFTVVPVLVQVTFNQRPTQVWALALEVRPGLYLARDDQNRLRAMTDDSQRAALLVAVVRAPGALSGQR